jgi:hypothetical protein
MEFLPWKTVDLDGAFRVTAPESIAEEVIQEVSNAVTFRFRGYISKVKLEILLTPPWGWEESFPADEQESPPAGFFCRLISRSTGRRLLVPLEPDGFGLWVAEISYDALLDGEEIRAEALLVRTSAALEAQDGLAGRKGQIVGRSRIHVVRFSGRSTSDEPIFQLRWESFPSGRSQQLWRLQPGEPPTLELNADVATPLRRLLMSRSRRRSGGALQRDALFTTICSSVWPLLVADVLHHLQRALEEDSGLSGAEAIDSLSGWQVRLLGLFAAGLVEADVPLYAALPLVATELRSPGGFSRLLMKMPGLIQEETKLVQLAEAMADAQQVQPGDESDSSKPSTEVEAA